MSDIDESTLECDMKQLREAMKRDEVNISMGYCFRDSDVDVEEQTSRADKSMYQEKEVYHRTRYMN